MSQLTNADLVWNRAALDGGGTEPRDGDSALSALLGFHSLAMSGGAASAIEMLPHDEIARSAEGFRWYGLDAVATFLETSTSRLQALSDDVTTGESLESKIDGAYSELVPSDMTLVSAFQTRFAVDPEAFQPLR